MFTTTDVLETARTLVEEFGADYTYEAPEKDRWGQPKCMYRNPDGSPSCMVGHIADRLGAPLPKYGDEEGLNDEMSANGLYSEAYPDVFDSGAIQLLETMQEEQDGGKSWGYALRKAESLA